MDHDKPRSSIRVVSSFNPWRTPVHCWYCQQRLTCQKYTSRGTWFGIWWAAGTTWWLPGALQLSWTLGHVAMHLLNPAWTNQHLCFDLPLFFLTLDCNQSNGFKATLQIHAQILHCPQSFTNNDDQLLLHPLLELVPYSQDLLNLDPPPIHPLKRWWVSLLMYSTGRFFAPLWVYCLLNS